MKMCINCLLMIDDHLTQCPHCGYTEGVNPMDYCHLPPRTVLNNRYILGRPLGSGGFGVTYIAWDTVLDIRVAIKEYMPGELAQRTAGTVNVMVNQSTTSVFMQGKRSFIDESLRLARLGDIPGVVKIFDCFEDNFTAYIVMEFLEGETLLSRIEREGKMSCEELLPIMVKVLEALEKIHAAGLMHRDIAPDNIMLCRDGRVCLIDFGAARHMTTRHSRSLSTVLKIGYAPAEQYYKDGNQGSWTDVYAVGATMYHALTGVIPTDAYTRANNDTLARPSTYVRIPHDIEVAILNAMNVTVEKRTQTARELADQLTGEEKPRRVHDRIRQTKLAVSGKTKALLGISIAAFAAVLALILIGVPQLVVHRTEAKVPEGMSRVPAVQSSPLPEAERLLSDSDLRLRVSQLIHDDYFDRDIVLYQNPSAGSVAYIGSMVDVTVSAPEETVPVPDVMGFEGTDAADSLREAGFEVVTREEYSDTFAPGSVMYQSVAPEEAVKPGSVIELVISLGPENSTIDTTVEVTVPNVTGMTFEQAQTALLAQNLYITKEATEYSDTVPAGQIIRQSPSASQTANQGDKVSVVVSAGKQTATVPDVHYYSEAAARAKITSSNLSVSVNYEESTTVSSGLVIRQDKAAGTSLNPGDTVTIWVSTGYQVAVPSCVGKPQTEAISALTAARLAYYVTTQNSTTVPAGQVMSQSVAAGQKVEQGTAITLTVSSGTSVVSVTGVSVSPSKLGMNIGDSYTLAAAVKPSDATTSAVTWKSDNTSVADVSASGIVTAKGAGTATITVTTVDGGKTASCTVTVSKSLTSISILSSPGKTVYFIGNKLDKSGLSVQAAYNDGSAADVTGKCTISGFDSSTAGTKTVTVSYTENGVTRNASFTVVVSAPLLSSITINSYPAKTEYYTGDSLDSSGLSVTAYYTDGSSKDVTSGCVLSGFDVSVEGTQTIPVTISYTEGSISKSASYSVTVTKPTITLSQTYISMIEGETVTLTATVVPSGAPVTWSTVNGGIAEVSADGKVTARSDGGTTITASMSYGGKSYATSCLVDVSAASTDMSQFTYELVNNEITITGYTGSDVDVVVPSSFDGHAVTAIADWAFSISNLRTVTIPSSVKRIGDAVFFDCVYLEDVYFECSDVELGRSTFVGCNSMDSVVLPKGLKTIPQETFLDCKKLVSFTVPDGIESLGQEAFAGCPALESVSLPDTLKSIEREAFARCESLRSITIPAGVTSISGDAFAACSSLKTINIESGNAVYKSDNGVVFSKDGKRLVAYPRGRSGAYTIPDGVTAVGDGAFSFCDVLTSVTVPNGVTSIGENAFIKCTILGSINIPDSVTSIGEGAFWYCEKLTSIIVPNGVTSIGAHTFANCKMLSSIIMPNSVTSIGEGAFWYCEKLTSIILPDSVTSIGEWAFTGCNSLTSIILPDSVTSIGEGAFSGCNSLTSITIPSGVSDISASELYSRSSLENITISCGTSTVVPALDFSKFNYLKTVTIGEGITKIGPNAFADCESLTTVVMPNSVTGIGNFAFARCGSLSTIVLSNRLETIGTRAFTECDALTSIAVPNGVTGIGSFAFSGCNNLVSAAIPSSVTELNSQYGTQLFQSCPNVTVYCDEDCWLYLQFEIDGYTLAPYDQYPG